MDFYQIKQKTARNGVIEVYPDFKVCRSKDLMVRGKAFYGVWDEESGLWSTDEYDVPRLVDKELYDYANKFNSDGRIIVKALADFSSKSWLDFRSYMTHISDSSHQLDEKLTFSNTEVTKKDYVSKRLPYPLEKCDISAYEEIISTLYEPDERAKIEWSIGAIVSGDSKTIQKFIVLYGEAGAGKSTILNIIQKLFEGYYTTFEAKALTTSNNAFATEVFKSNPLVAIQHDGDLSRIEDNAKLNSIVSHEEIIINEKFKSSYASKVNCFLYMATNRPVKITDAKSGIIRRLIDVKPSGNKVEPGRYNELMERIPFELGGIAYHCLEVYKKMGKNYYNSYRPIDMMYKTDPFFNFVEDMYEEFKEQDGTSLKSAYSRYKEYCDNTNADHKLQMYKFREELKNYFSHFDDMTYLDGKLVRSYYSGFLKSKFERKLKVVTEEKRNKFSLDQVVSTFDILAADYPAQYATDKETPACKWEHVSTKLSDLDTTRLHYVKVPENHIVIDFDLKDENGEKSLEKNLEAASKWPPTYAEYSKSGSGIHLHYIYTGGDPADLSRVYDDNIEVKVFTGNSSLRRKLVKCNNLEVATINSGLPLKEKGDKMVNTKSIEDEKHLRILIRKALAKEVHAYTRPNMDFIFKILDDAYNSGMKYDVTDMRPAIMAFAVNSSNQSDYCLKLLGKMQFKSDEPSEMPQAKDDDPIVFYDVEVFPNLFLINWKTEGPQHKVHRMINPTPLEVEEFMKFKLVGYNCRRYDNHIIWARMMGYSNEALFELSQRIINGSSNCMFGEAYNVSFTDIYDFASTKQSLKKWEIELGITHLELGLPWDEPVPEEMWEKVAEYCDNDVISTEAVFHCKKIQADFAARCALAKIAGGIPNDTTNSLTTKLIFGNNRHPQGEFIYTDLSKDFPGYKFECGKSSYRDVEEVGEGGYVYSDPGIYHNVVTFDVASMHPHSVIALQLFGDRYTQRFKELVEARIAIKHRDVTVMETIFDGAFKEFINATDEELKNLANALKIAINSVYGLTSAKFENPFRDPRNIDNIVAKRGALFMINLRNEVQKRGGKVVHVKTDSIKIENPTQEMWDFVMEYGKQYGYTFEVEDKFEKICLVNDAVYIAKVTEDDPEWIADCKKAELAGKEPPTRWHATGTQFQVPYVFKTLFSHEPIEFEDMCETKSVKTALYLDFNEGLPEDEHDYHFVGKVGRFTPIKAGCGGATLVASRDDKYVAATGTKGFRWMESEVVKNLNKQDDIDKTYYKILVDKAVSEISKYGDFEAFTA